MSYRRFRLAALASVACTCLLLIQACDLSQPAANPTSGADAGAAGQAGMDAAFTQPPMQAVTVVVPPQYRSVYNGPTVITMPVGFGISVFAAGLGSARLLTFGACGDLFAGSMFTYTTRLPDRNHDGVADSVIQFNTGMADPVNSIEYYNGQYYVASRTEVDRFDQATCDSGPSNPTTLVSGLPSGGGHYTRTLIHGPDGAMYISIGASCNVCIETDPRRAAISRFFNGQFETYASGLRNDVGLAFRPGTSELWSVENGADDLSDNAPPEEVNLIQEHQYYGWPYCYGDGTPDPRVSPPRPDYCSSGMVQPVVMMQAHSAPLGLAFSQNTNVAFPDSWKQGFFVAFHGSYNRTVPTGYKVVYIPAFASHSGHHWNPPTIDLAVGALPSSFPPPDAIWRPAGLAVGPDGALYVSRDNGDGTVYRITYATLMHPAK